MFKQVFFDDQRLFVRENLERQYGTPELVGTYRDPHVRISYGWAWGIQGPDGKTHLIYEGYETGSSHIITAAAISDDGIHFTPRNTALEAGIENPHIPNQLLPCSNDHSEIATIIDDIRAIPEERYKMLFTDYSLTGTQSIVIDYILVSPDLIHWKKLNGSCWNPQGTEPLTGVFYNKIHDAYTILSRPDWGQRRVGITETKDWHYYTPLEMCLQCDSLDPALAEIYGMPAIAYGDMFIGFPHIYSNFPQGRFNKFNAGTMYPELAYSLNGHHWQRSLRKPFLSGEHPQLVQRDNVTNGMVYLLAALPQPDTSILLYATTNKHEHGHPIDQTPAEDTSVSIFSLRQDGFIRLATTQPDVTGTLATREIVFSGNELTINLNCQSATCAIYDASQGFGKQPCPGFAHEDCIPAKGDNPHWHPQWKNGADLSTLIGNTVILEIKLTDGAVYAISGDGAALMNIEALRYRRYKTLPQRPGFQI